MVGAVQISRLDGKVARGSREQDEERRQERKHKSQLGEGSKHGHVPGEAFHRFIFLLATYFRLFFQLGKYSVMPLGCG